MSCSPSTTTTTTSPAVSSSRIGLASISGQEGTPWPCGLTLAGMADRLASYRAKRDSAATPEPAGAEAVEAPADAPRFVVQEHHARRLHWDLRLERDGVLVSWAVPRGIPPDPARNHLAGHTEDHPLMYLEFSGEIPTGHYGAGKMTIWDEGTYETEKWSDREVMVVLHGE